MKLSDFGLGRSVTIDDLATTTAGTPGYVAPEVVERKPYDWRCDYWSLAVTIFVLLSGTPPFFHQDNFELFELIKAGAFKFSAPAWEKVSDEAKDFICGLLKTNPDDRMSVYQIQTHPWYTGDFNSKGSLDQMVHLKDHRTKCKNMI